MIVATSILAPLGAGVVFRVLSPTAADRIARPLSMFGTVLLFVAFVPVLIAQWRFIVALVGNFTLEAACQGWTNASPSLNDSF